MEIQKRITLAAVIILIYAATVFLVSATPLTSWKSLSFGLLTASLGSVAIFTLLRQWEANLANKIQKIPLPAVSPLELPLDESLKDKEELQKTLQESQTRSKELVEELNLKNEALHKLETEKTQFQQRIDDVHHELAAYKENTEEEVRRKTVLLSEYQETINQQRDVIKKKQELISELENKVRDLNYEVKTLLQLAEIGNKNTDSKDKETATDEPHQADMFEEEEKFFQSKSLLLKTPEEASFYLKRCIDIAQKIAGGNRFGNANSRFKDFPIDNRALDLRRLFDSLRSENAGTVIVYSQKEDCLLFASDQTASLLGWGPEKFIKNFSEIIDEAKEEWKNGVSALSTSPLSKIRMVMKTKSGQNLLVHCHLGIIPTGAFRNHIIGILYSA